MTADLPCTVRRIDGGSSWHLPRAEADGGQPGEIWCGASGRMDGLAVGTRGLRICDACVAAVRAAEAVLARMAGERCPECHCARGHKMDCSRGGR